MIEMSKSVCYTVNMTERRLWVHKRPMACAALGAILAAILGSFAPDRVLLIVCAVLIPISAFLFHRRNAFFLLPLAAFAVLIRIVLLPTELPDGALASFASNLRGNMLKNADALFRDEAAAARGMLLGDRSAMTAAAYTQYAQSGLLHLFAVSGLHVTIFVGMIGRLVRTENKALSLGIHALILLLFSAITGFSASVLRASFSLIALRFTSMQERKADMPSVLCFTFAMTLLCEPFAFRTVGFQLSFAAMTGMVLFAGKFRRSLPKSLQSTMTARAVFGAIAAMIGMLPLTAYYFGSLAWVAVPLSILLIPTMPVILLFGLLSVLLFGILPGVATMLSYPAYGAIRIVSFIVQSVNVPSLQLPAPHPLVIVLYYLGLFLCSSLLLPNRKRPPWIGLGLLASTMILWYLI